MQVPAAGPDEACAGEKVSVKRSILFVDDEPRVLAGMRRMLRGMRHEWDMDFVESGHEALERMASSPIDVVVSDMRMPIMDGAQLLDEVMRRHPHVVRIILSGHSDRQAILRSVGSTHQYLAKPCGATTLKNTISRACELRGILESEPLRRLVARLESVPALPTLYAELMEELKSPHVSMSKVGEIVSKDLGMSAKILQIINSAFFGLPTRVSCPTHAVQLLGLETIKALALTVQVFGGFASPDSALVSHEALLRHGLKTAALARAIMKAEKADQSAVDDSFLGGLLHDLGILVLTTHRPESYRDALALMRDEQIPVWDAEKKIFGASHGEVGGYLIGLWGLPMLLVEAVTFHHNPSESVSRELGPLAAVHVASTLVSEGELLSELNDSASVDEGYLQELGVADRLPAWEALVADAGDGCES